MHAVTLEISLCKLTESLPLSRASSKEVFYIMAVNIRPNISTHRGLQFLVLDVYAELECSCVRMWRSTSRERVQRVKFLKSKCLLGSLLRSTAQPRLRISQRHDTHLRAGDVIAGQSPGWPFQAFHLSSASVLPAVVDLGYSRSEARRVQTILYGWLKQPSWSLPTLSWRLLQPYIKLSGPCWVTANHLTVALMPDFTSTSLTSTSQNVAIPLCDLFGNFNFIACS